MKGASLKQLRYFEAVARFGHFGRAAEHCAVTQPALSMQVQELERHLGVSLIERRPRGVLLTQAGQEILERARKVLSELQSLEDYARSCGEPLTGRLHLGIIPTIAPYMLPSLLASAKQRFGALDLRIRETQTHTLLQELEDGMLDLLVIALPVDQHGTMSEPLFEDRFLLAAPPSDAAPELDRVLATPDLLRDSRVLLLEEGHCFRDQALSVCHRPGGEAVDTFGASSLSTIVQMVANGMGVTLLPEMSLTVEARDGKLRLMRFADPEPSRSIGLVWRESSSRAEEFRALGRLIVEVMTAKADRDDAAGGPAHQTVGGGGQSAL